MAPLQFLFFFLLITSNEGSSIKPFVSLDPNWATVFTKESVTLTCNVDPPEPRDQIYYWYRDNQIVPLYLGAKSVKIDHAKQEHGGSYQCQTAESDKSEPVRLQVTHSWLTLKVPPFVFEGDELYVSCAGYPGYSARDAVLYKDNEVIGSSPSDADFLVGTTNMTTSGLYRCTRQVKDGVVYYSYSSEEHISVKELFSKPVAKVTESHSKQGKVLTITCDTKLSPRKATTELQFAFYRNGRNVQGFSLSNQHGVPSAQLEHSGNYTCEVQTPTGSVRKRSNMAHIQIQERSYAPIGIGVTLALLILVIIVALLVYEFRNRVVSSFLNRHNCSIRSGIPVFLKIISDRWDLCFKKNTEHYDDIPLLWDTWKSVNNESVEYPRNRQDMNSKHMEV
ncbi:Fc receptor-like B isoform X2 [Xenopus laevis]|uniref:Fc receptor-like B isoform X2 n=1 Tax=Xenopus laevis TaxID=8355 RepID=A0A8J1LK31_XENLA|nr:Fc receptor-like B isoform X2 [Xenopus laevis]